MADLLRALMLCDLHTVPWVGSFCLPVWQRPRKMKKLSKDCTFAQRRVRTGAGSLVAGTSAFHHLSPLPMFSVSPSLRYELGFPGCSYSKESACNARDLGSIPGLGGSPGEVYGYPLQYSGLENSMDCIVHGVTKGRT